MNMRIRGSERLGLDVGEPNAERRVRRRTGAILPRLRLRQDGRLQLCSGDEQWVDVTPVRCFPWSEAGRFISLRDEANTELSLIDDAETLEPDTRAALLRALEVSGFFLEIVEVDSIEEDFEIRVWKVKTRRGPRSFQTELDAWPYPSPGGGHLISDVAGDVFFIPPLPTLDEASQKQLWPYVG